MEPDIRKASVALLRAEMDAIYLADRLYWLQGNRSDRAARASYQRRLARLEEIRNELARFAISRKRRGKKGEPMRKTLRREE
jgi:hypothetical protein